MQSFDFKKLLPHLIAISIFVVVALFFSYPVLEGKELYQGDVMHWKAMAKEGIDWHEKTGENVLWSNSMFGGMPTYTYYVPESNNYLAYLHYSLFGAISKPASFFLIAMLCFYMLMRCLKINQWLSIGGAIAYALTSYNIDSIIAGHDTKIFSVGYLPAVIAGLLYIHRSEWWKGIPLLGISLALMISVAHYQIIYYTIITIVFAVVGLFVIAIKQSKIKEFFISSGVALVVAALACSVSLQLVMSVAEYNKSTMRGGQSELTFVKHDEGKKSGGLDKEYAFRWSNSIGETFCLMIPYLYGGGSGAPIESAEKFAEVTGGQMNTAPLYWGPQPFLGASTYFGAIICFLFVLGIMVVRSPHKWWIVAACALSIMMSWGKHFPALNYFLFDTLPLLNKFRTPSMVLAIAQLLFPVLGLWGLQEIVYGNQTKEELLKKLKIALGITAGLCVVLAFGGSMFFDFTGAADKQFPEQYRQQLVDALREDRQALATKSALTSAVYILLAGGLLWAYLKDKLKDVKMVIGGIVLLIAIDIMSVARHYLTEDKFVEKEEVETVTPRPVDQQILADKDPYYRVLDISTDPYNDATQAYFHKCIGGYSPAKMEAYQDMIDVHMSGSFNTEVLNMLNTKYIIFNSGNAPVAAPNTTANGNGWFVNEVKWANTADEEILALNAKKLGDTAELANAFNSKNTAVIRNTFKNELDNYSFGKDSAAKIMLTKYGLNDLSFQSKNSQNGLAVFADIYYPYGWKAYVDGKETPIIKANYLLRAIKVPAGDHKIEFKFHPETFYKYDRIAGITSLLLIGLCGFSLFRLIKPGKKEETA